MFGIKPVITVAHVSVLLHSCLRMERNNIRSGSGDEKLVHVTGNLVVSELLFACNMHPLRSGTMQACARQRHRLFFMDLKILVPFKCQHDIQEEWKLWTKGGQQRIHEFC